MSESLLVSTRKGLFTITRTGMGRNPWAISKVDFLADNVSLALFDKRDGRTYAALDHGHFGVKLPQEHAYDIVLRHALCRLGSTTGGLWVSEDQGDHWHCVSHTLPPIYAVRFAAA